MSGKSDAASAIEHAQNDLREALARLALVPAIDADRLTYAAHALNNYLMVVSTIAHVLRAGIGRMSEAEVVDRLEALGQATRLMKNMVREIHGPHDENPLTLVFLPVDLTAVARAASEEYESVARAKRIEIVRELADAPVTVWADRIALGAVLDNLISNAIKYSPLGGVVRVRTSATAEQGVCSIFDSGPGIDEVDVARLFTRGAKLSSRPTGGETTSGYGLAIAKDLVDSLGGRIWFEKVAAGGALFSFSVPLYDPARHRVERPQRGS